MSANNDPLSADSQSSLNSQRKIRTTPGDYEIIIKKILNNINKIVPSTECHAKKINLISHVLSNIDFKEFSALATCHYSLKKLKESNIELLINDPEEYIDALFYFTQLITKEKISWTQGATPIDYDVLKFYDNKKELTPSEKKYATILSCSFSGISNQIEYLHDWESKIENYRNELKKNYSKYNFVNLSRAFTHLLASKRTELAWQKILTILLALATFISPIAIFYYNFFHNEVPWAGKISLYFPVLAVEILLIYYFRINLKLFFNIKTQIL